MPDKLAEDLTPCSWCGLDVPDGSLVEVAGDRICPTCRKGEVSQRYILPA